MPDAYPWEVGEGSDFTEFRTDEFPDDAAKCDDIDVDLLTLDLASVGFPVNVERAQKSCYFPFDYGDVDGHVRVSTESGIDPLTPEFPADMTFAAPDGTTCILYALDWADYSVANCANGSPDGDDLTWTRIEVQLLDQRTVTGPPSYGRLSASDAFGVLQAAIQSVMPGLAGKADFTRQQVEEDACNPAPWPETASQLDTLRTSVPWGATVTSDGVDYTVQEPKPLTTSDAAFAFSFGNDVSRPGDVSSCAWAFDVTISTPTSHDGDDSVFVDRGLFDIYLNGSKVQVGVADPEFDGLSDYYMPLGSTEMFTIGFVAPHDATDIKIVAPWDSETVFTAG